jgi:hypothetical protein
MPIPSSAPIEGGSSSNGDRHVLVLDNGNCFLYEMYNASPNSDGSWNADSTAVWDLLGSEQRPYTWTSADAAGLPIFPGLVRYDEVAVGKIQRSDSAAHGNAPSTEVQLRHFRLLHADCKSF